MALRTIKTAIAGLLSLQQYESDFKPVGTGSSNLKRDENATALAVQSIVDKLTGPSGTVANFTYTVPNLAARPAVNTLPNGTLIFVESQKSWYWTDLDSNTYRRVVQANPAWMAQAAWGIDTVNGNDENVGSVASPLRTADEFFARMPTVNQSIVVTIAAGSTIPSWEWQPVIENGSTGSVTVQGVRTLGANRVVASSSDETGTQTPRIDAGFAFTPGTILQATSGAQSGATAAVGAAVAGTNFMTSTWRNVAGNRVAPPAPTDTVAVVTLPTVTFWSQSMQGVVFPFVAANLAIGSIDDSYVCFHRYNTCTFASFIFVSLGFYTFDGCSINGGVSVFAAPGTFFTACGFFGVAAIQISSGKETGFQNCVVTGGGNVIARDGSYVVITGLGVVGATIAGLQCISGAYVRINGTLYGSGNALGTLVFQGGTLAVNAAITPTLTAIGAELQLDQQGTAIPALVGGLAVPNAAALTSWGQWVGAPFNRSVVGLQGPAGQASGARIIGS